MARSLVQGGETPEAQGKRALSLIHETATWLTVIMVHFHSGAWCVRRRVDAKRKHSHRKHKKQSKHATIAGHFRVTRCRTKARQERGR